MALKSKKNKERKEAQGIAKKKKKKKKREREREKKKKFTCKIIYDVLKNLNQPICAKLDEVKSIIIKL